MTTASPVLRPARSNDCALYYEWRSDPHTMAAAFSPEPIRWEDHQRWFERRLTDPFCRMFLLEHDGVPVAQVRFDLHGSAAEVHISVAPAERGKRHGVTALRQATATLLRDDPNVQTVVAHVKPENTASVRCFLSAGFAPIGRVDHAGQVAEAFILRRSSPA